jgi:hypothetical protein
VPTQCLAAVDRQWVTRLQHIGSIAEEIQATKDS